jgi:pimeloyl-ACP methyl ester carboxylesterase
MRPLVRLLLLGVAILLAGCQTDLALVDLKERYGGPPSRYLPMDGIEVHWRDEGPSQTREAARAQAQAPASTPPAVAAAIPSAAMPWTASAPAAAFPAAALPWSSTLQPSGAPPAGMPLPAPPWRAAPAAASPAPPAQAPWSAAPDAPAPAPAPLRPPIAAAAAEPPALLLLHGTAASLHTWDGWASRLSPHLRVVRLDLPGFGLTGPYPSGDYSAAATSDFLERFANAAGLRRFVLAGSSLGGYYAWRFALRHPDRVSALILIDSVGYPLQASSSSAVALQVARMPVISELIRWVPIRGAVRRSLLDVYVDDSLVTPALVDRYADLMRRPGNRAAFGDRTRADPRPTGFERLPELRMPTLIQWGGQDTWIPVEHAERFGRDIPGARTIVYPRLGHLPMEEDPASTANDALEFLRRVVPGVGGPIPQK